LSPGDTNAYSPPKKYYICCKGQRKPDGKWIYRLKKKPPGHEPNPKIRNGKWYLDDDLEIW